MSERGMPAWIPSARFEDAVLYATRAHALQARKGGTIPYLTHLFGVASLVVEDGGSEDETIAALLHDAGEDQGGEPRVRDIADRFGKSVAQIVRECSDTLETPKPPAEVRKPRFVASLATASPGAIRVSLADKLHNARSMAADHAVVGEELWERFNVKTRASHEKYYRDLSAAFHAAGASQWLLRQFNAALDELFPGSRPS
ncbi:MAG: HD domain-containing protein [Chloroflexota bacterium]|nr:HD domain-containing protein [Chloroflexota bacterium]